MISTLLVLAYFFHRIFSTTTDFCNLDCGKDHLVCKRGVCAPSIICGSEFTLLPLNTKEIKMIVEMHNNFRNSIAQSWMELPKASNMMSISYSKELAFVALCFATDCKLDVDPKICRSVQHYQDIGQNIEWIIDKENVSPEELLNNSVSAWINEFVYFDSSWIKDYPNNKKSKLSSKFTQMISAQTIFIGCARIRFGSEIIDRLVLVCNYAPGGLNSGETVFQVGRECSECPKDTQCGTIYKFLCGEVRNLEEDDWIEPFEIKDLGVTCNINVNLILIFIIIIII